MPGLLFTAEEVIKLMKGLEGEGMGKASVRVCRLVLYTHLNGDYCHASWSSVV